MDDCVDAIALEDLPHPCAIPGITFHKAELLVLRDRLQAGQVASVSQQIIADNDVAGMMLDPPLNEVATDEPGSACNQHSTHVVFFSLWLITASRSLVPFTLYSPRYL